MNPIRRTAVALKKVGQATAMRFAGRMRTSLALLARGTRFDYRRAVGDGLENSIVMSCLLYLARTFPEAPMRVSKRQPDASFKPLEDHPLHDLIENPNPFYSGETLWMATLCDFIPSGNAFWRKIRNAQRGVIQLWWVPKGLISPAWPDDGSEFISHYEYKPDPMQTTPERVEVEDIVHFRFGLDPNNMRLGMSPIASVLREVFSDDEAASFSGTLLRNMGIPGAVISPKGDNRLTDGEAEQVKSVFDQKFGGDNRGAVMVTNAPAEFQMVSFNPQQMDLKTLRRLPEERIAAVLGVPAGVVGLGAGLDRNTYSNVEEGRKALYESNLIPTQRLFATTVRSQLLPDFGDTKGLRIEFDTSNVRALQESQDKLWERADKGVRGGWLTVGAAMRIVSQDAGPEFDYYLRPLMVEAVPMEQAGFPREPIASRANADPNALLATATEVQQGPAALPAPSGATPPADGQPPPTPPAKHIVRLEAKSSEPHARRIQRLSGPYKDALTRYFDDQQRAILKAWNAQKALTHAGSNGHGPQTKAMAVDDLLGSEWDDVLRKLSVRFYLAVGEEAIGLAQSELGIEGLYDLALPRITSAADRMARKVVAVNDTTRDMLRGAITRGSDAGYTLEQIAQGVPEDGYGGIKGVMTEAKDSRARMISRTETANGMNVSTIDSYAASGVVSSVLVVDGDEDEACASVNGQTWDLARAAAEPTAHPNCTRGFSPIVGARHDP